MAAGTQFLESSMIAADKGHWVWNEANAELSFQSTLKSRASRSKPRPWLPQPTSNHPEEFTTDGGTVTLSDIKAAAVKLIDEDTIRKTRHKTCVLFDECSKTKQMDDLLWCTLLYYNCLREHNRAMSDENVSVPGSLGDGAREVLRKWRKELLQSKLNLGEVYSLFILGLGHSNSHHCQAGSDHLTPHTHVRSRVSRTQTDREFYEVLYEFLVYVVWITFRHKEWEVIHKELGCFFRTPQFNRDFKHKEPGATYINVEGVGEIHKGSDQYLTYRVLYDRPFVGMLREMHSDAHVSYLPEPKDKTPLVFDSNVKPLRQEEIALPSRWSVPERLGIIGDIKSKYDLGTLKCLETESVTCSDSEESAYEADSQVSGIIEDEGDTDNTF